MSPLVYERPARTGFQAAVLLAVWGAILWLWHAVDAAPIVVAGLLLLTAPAAVDFATGRRAGLRLDDRMLRWHSGRQQAEIALARIEMVRFERRLDMTMRVRIITDTGQKLKIPQDAQPPHERLEAALNGLSVRCERHPFALI